MMFGLGSDSVLPGASHHGSGLVPTLFYGGASHVEPKLQRPAGCGSGSAAATQGTAAACLGAAASRTSVGSRLLDRGCCLTCISGSDVMFNGCQRW